MFCCQTMFNIIFFIARLIITSFTIKVHLDFLHDLYNIIQEIPKLFSMK